MARLRDIIEAKERERLLEAVRDVAPRAEVRQNWAGVFVRLWAEDVQAMEQAIMDAGFTWMDAAVGEDGRTQIFIRVKATTDLIEKCLGKKGKKGKTR